MNDHYTVLATSQGHSQILCPSCGDFCQIKSGSGGRGREGEGEKEREEKGREGEEGKEREGGRGRKRKKGEERGVGGGGGGLQAPPHQRPSTQPQSSVQVSPSFGTPN